MRNKLLSLAMIITLILVTTTLFATGTMETSTKDIQTVSAIDAAGETVVVNPPLESIAIIGKAAIMPADALYLFESPMDATVTMAKTDQGMGDFFSLLIPEEKQTKRLGQTINGEEIVAMDPDLILTKSRNRDAIETQIQQFDIPLFAMDLETSSAWKEEIVQLGKLLQESDRAQMILTEIEKREEGVKEKVATAKRPEVLVLQGSTSDGFTSFSIPPASWIQTELVKNAGGTPIVESDSQSTGWSVVSFEQIAAWDPDYIVIVSYKSKGTPYIQSIYKDPQWKELTAVKEGQLLLAPADFVNYFQPNSRWILALQWLAKTIHPELFSEVDMAEEVATFYQDFYHIEDSEQLDYLVNLYKESLN